MSETTPASAAHAPPSVPAPGLPGRSLQLLGAYLLTRLGLMGLDLADARDHLFACVLKMGAALLLIGLCLISLSVAVTIYFWDTWRWQSLLALAMVYGAAAALQIRSVMRQIRQSPKLLASSLDVLEKDFKSWRQEP